MRPGQRLALCLIAALWLGLAACAPLQDYGRIDPSGAATQAFESYSINPGFRYYISGSDLYPTAVIGLKRDIRLSPDSLWREVEMTRERMEEIVGYRARLYHSWLGYEIVDNKGNPIGVWYSRPYARTFIQMLDDGSVRIDTPTRHAPTYGGEKMHSR